MTRKVPTALDGIELLPVRKLTLGFPRAESSSLPALVDRPLSVRAWSPGAEPIALIDPILADDSCCHAPTVRALVLEL